MAVPGEVRMTRILAWTQARYRVSRRKIAVFTEFSQRLFAIPFGPCSGRHWHAIPKRQQGRCRPCYRFVSRRLVAALVFAVLHGGQNAALFVHRLGFGLIAGVLVWATGGLEAAIAAHVVNNVFAFTYSLFTGGIVALKAMTAISWGVALVDLVGFAVFGSIAWWLGLRLRVAILTP